MSEVATRRRRTLRTFDQGERHASWLELFFDLCFVAAVAALADGLHRDPSASGLLWFAALFVPVWWAWMIFTWYGTAFERDDASYRIGLFAAMLAVIAMAANVVGVPGGDDQGFVVTYALVFVVAAALFAWAWGGAGPARSLCVGYAVGNLLGAAIWLASLLVQPPVRYWMWGVAIVGLMVTPVLAVRSVKEQVFDSSHIPERYGLFTLIVLGESVVVVAATVAEFRHLVDAGIVAALGFGLAACIWWTYFDFVRSSSLRRDHLMSSFVWSYAHLLVYAGVAAAAVGVEFAIEATAEGDLLAAVPRAALTGGLVAFLLGITAIHAVTVARIDTVLLVRLGIIAGVVLFGLGAGALPPVAIVGFLFALAAAGTAAEAALARAGRHPAAPRA